MLHYAIVFLVIALIAAVLGFGGIAGAAAGIAKILFLVCLVHFLVTLFHGRRRPPVRTASTPSSRVRRVRTLFHACTQADAG
jgi:uncharacterized membrane protein YtjA (UPF0391 family)